MFGNPEGEVGGDQRQRDLDLRIPRAMSRCKESQPIATPNRTSLTTMTAKVPVAFGSENSPVEIAATANR